MAERDGRAAKQAPVLNFSALMTIAYSRARCAAKGARRNGDRLWVAMNDPFPRWLLFLSLAVPVAAIVLIAIEEPQRFLRDAWLPVVAIAAIVFFRWWARR